VLYNEVAFCALYKQEKNFKVFADFQQNTNVFSNEFFEQWLSFNIDGARPAKTFPAFE